MSSFAEFHNNIRIANWDPLSSPGDFTRGVTDVDFFTPEDGMGNTCFIPTGKAIRLGIYSCKNEFPLRYVTIRDWKQKDIPGCPLPHTRVSVQVDTREVVIRRAWEKSFENVCLKHLGRYIPTLTVWHAYNNHDLFGSLPTELKERALLLRRIAYGDIPLN